MLKSYQPKFDGVDEPIQSNATQKYEKSDVKTGRRNKIRILSKPGILHLNTAQESPLQHPLKILVRREV